MITYWGKEAERGKGEGEMGKERWERRRGEEIGREGVKIKGRGKGKGKEGEKGRGRGGE